MISSMTFGLKDAKDHLGRREHLEVHPLRVFQALRPREVYGRGEAHRQRAWASY